MVSKASSGCPFRDNDLAGRYKCKDNHTQTNADVVPMTPGPRQLQYDYLSGVGLAYVKALSKKKDQQVQQLVHQTVGKDRVKPRAKIHKKQPHIAPPLLQVGQ